MSGNHNHKVNLQTLPIQSSEKRLCHDIWLGFKVRIPGIFSHPKEIRWVFQLFINFSGRRWEIQQVKFTSNKPELNRVQRTRYLSN